MNKTIKTALYSCSVLIIALAIVTFVTKGSHQASNFGLSVEPAATADQASLAVLSPASGTVNVGQKQDVSWTSSDYKAPTVSIAVIRKVSDNPARYELVRTVTAATQNDGSAVWVPSKSDVGQNTLIQVGCALTAQACTAGTSNGALAVIDTGKYSNAAATWQAIEQLNDK